MNTRCSQKISPPPTQSSISKRIATNGNTQARPLTRDFFVPGRLGAKRTPSLLILSRCVVARGLLLCHPCYLETHTWYNYLNCKTFLFLDPNDLGKPLHVTTSPLFIVMPCCSCTLQSNKFLLTPQYSEQTWPRTSYFLFMVVWWTMWCVVQRQIF